MCLQDWAVASNPAANQRADPYPGENHVGGERQTPGRRRPARGCAIDAWAPSVPFPKFASHEEGRGAVGSRRDDAA